MFQSVHIRFGGGAPRWPLSELVAAGELFEITRSRPHGHVAAVAAMARRLGLLGPACRERDLAYALIVARACRPGSKLATVRWWADTTLAPDLGIEAADTDEVYAAMDWLLERQPTIEQALAGRHLTPGGLVLYDLSSSWLEGRSCPLAGFGQARDGRRGKPQICYGLVTDADGRPVAVNVFPGNTADPRLIVLPAESGAPAGLLANHAANPAWSRPCRSRSRRTSRRGPPGAPPARVRRPEAAATSRPPARPP